jgi:hypothetical protein
MPDIAKDIVALGDPTNIKNAQLASSPYVLRKVFADDPRIKRLVIAGEKVVPIIATHLGRANSLDDISLSAYAFIVESVNADAAPKIFGNLLRKAMKEASPFFVHFAAQAIRSGLRLPVKPMQNVYSTAEMIETLNMIH